MLKTLVGFFLTLGSFNSWALAPVEGIIRGQAKAEIQTDPVRFVFLDEFDESQDKENIKLKLYQDFLEESSNLPLLCPSQGPLKYATEWKEKQARRALASTLQYLGLDTAIKAIGAYAVRLDVDEKSFNRLKKNLLTNYCSKNLTVISLKTIDKSLDFYYQNPSSFNLPSISSSPYATNKMKESSEKLSARSREFDLVINMFKTFCSWGGEVEDYRLMTPYLKNNFIMGILINAMSGFKKEVDLKTLKIIKVKNENALQVACVDLLCRKHTPESFQKYFPLSLGSTGLNQDLIKNYCFHFRTLDSPIQTTPEVKKWITETTEELSNREISHFISLLTGVPDFFSGLNHYHQIQGILKSSIEERWDRWARKVLGQFSFDMMYEEPLKIKLRSTDKWSFWKSRLQGPRLIFDVTLGELDRVMTDYDKLGLGLEFKLSKNYLRQLRFRWSDAINQVDLEGQAKLKDEVARYLELILKEKEKWFRLKIWPSEFYQIIADELIEWAYTYEGDLFSSYEDKMVTIPVQFNYGLFALDFLKTRYEFAVRRSKLKDSSSSSSLEF